MIIIIYYNTIILNKIIYFIYFINKYELLKSLFLILIIGVKISFLHKSKDSILYFY